MAPVLALPRPSQSAWDRVNSNAVEWLSTGCQCVTACLRGGASASMPVVGFCGIYRTIAPTIVNMSGLTLFYAHSSIGQ